MLDTNGTNKKTQKKTAALLPPPAVTEGVVPWVMSVMQIYRKVAKFCKKKSCWQSVRSFAMRVIGVLITSYNPFWGTYQPTSTIRWDRSIFHGSSVIAWLRWLLDMTVIEKLSLGCPNFWISQHLILMMWNWNTCQVYKWIKRIIIVRVTLTYPTGFIPLTGIFFTWPQGIPALNGFGKWTQNGELSS